jgi:hypothetical protein
MEYQNRRYDTPSARSLTKLHLNIILLSTSWFFKCPIHRNFLTKILYALLLSDILVKFPAHYNILGVQFLTLTSDNLYNS